MRIDKRVLENLPLAMKKKDDLPLGWLYIGDDTERYLIGKPGIANVLVVDAFPGMATPGDDNLDSVCKKVRKLSKEDGFDGWILTSLYPLRLADPDELPEKADKKLIEKNIKVLSMLEKSYYINKIWAAWGDVIDFRDYLGETLYNIQEAMRAEQWFYRGTTTRWGNPRQILKSKSGEEFSWFPVHDYAVECCDTGDLRWQ